MNLEVLHVAECPNLAALLDRIGEVTDLPVVTHQIDSGDEASARGMAGSPTLLVNGVDPFAAPDLGECGVSCRIYRDEEGQMTAAPSVHQLREALGAPGPAARLEDGFPEWATARLPVARGV